MLIDAFARALKNLLMPKMFMLFVLCLLAYILGWTALAWLLGELIQFFAHSVSTGLTWAEAAFAQGVGLTAGALLAWFLFPLLYPILISFFDETMAEAIEKKDYPHLPKATPPFWPTLMQDAWFSVKAVLLNLVLIPLYLVPFLGWALYYALNGYLLGMQFFRMSAGRRESRADSEALARKLRKDIILAGALVMFCATVPFLNLAAPLLGVATMLHLYHRARGNDRVEVLPPAPM